ncbi:MAG: hypothetical protein ABIF77_12025 [bacterium]
MWIILVMAIVFLLTDSLTGSPANADWGYDCFVSTAATQQVSVFTVPDGSGDPLTEAFAWGGSRMDATVTVELWSWSGYPLEGFPPEDLWLDTTRGSLTLCQPNGSMADGPTDANGVTTFSGSLRAGGATDPALEFTRVVVNGDPCSLYPVDIQFNSPDLNGNGVVNLTDVILFTGHFFGAYNYAADYFWDGQINLSDLAKMAPAFGALCP